MYDSNYNIILLYGNIRIHFQMKKLSNEITACNLGLMTQLPVVQFVIFLVIGP
jgi:hypothetical protein